MIGWVGIYEYKDTLISPLPTQREPGVLLGVLFTLFIYGLFNYAINDSGCMALTEREADKSPSFQAEGRNVLSTGG